MISKASIEGLPGLIRVRTLQKYLADAQGVGLSVAPQQGVMF